MNILDKILAFFGLCRLSVHEDELKKMIDTNRETLEMQQSTIDSLHLTIESLYSACNESRELIDKLQQRIDTVAFKTMEDYKLKQNALDAEHADLQKKIEEVLNFQKEVEKQVSRLLHRDEKFGFSGNFSFPGSTSIASEILHDNETGKPYITVYGRTVFGDEHSNKLGELLTLNEKLKYIVNVMFKQGIYDRITKDLMKLGAIQYTVGYNEDCTAYEVYYAINAYVPNSTCVCLIDGTKPSIESKEE